MTLLDHFYRVSRREPCRVCRKPDWCLHAREGGGFAGLSVCARVESPTRWGSAGWLHGKGPAGVRSSRSWRIDLDFGRPTGLNLPGLVRAAQARVTVAGLEVLAEELGVSSVSLQRLQVGRVSRDLSWRAGLRRDSAAWCFPMQRPGSGVCGVRLRLDCGGKLSVRGGREGLFVPEDIDLAHGRLVIAEGPTDTAALLDLGVPSIGRPSARGGSRLLERVAAAGRFDQIVVFGDRGSTGERGASDLALQLRLYCRDVRVVLPPCHLSDARDWVRSEGTRMRFERMVSDADPIECCPVFRAEEVHRD